MAINVVNKKQGGRGIYIGRPSPLGNPFVIGRDGTREEVIAKYKRWLEMELANPHSRVHIALNEIKHAHSFGNVNLVCWCAPLACHGDIIKRIVEGGQS